MESVGSMSEDSQCPGGIDFHQRQEDAASNANVSQASIHMMEGKKKRSSTIHDRKKGLMRVASSTLKSVHAEKI